MVDVGHHQRQRLVAVARFGNGRLDRDVEELAVGELRERIGQALGAHGLEVDLQFVDLGLGSVEARLELLVGGLHLLGGLHQTFDDGAQALAVLRLAELLGHVGETFGVAVGRAGGGIDHRHDLLDLVHHLAADIADAVGQACRSQIGFVDRLQVGIGEVAVRLQRLVDLLVEGRVVARRVGVPDLVIAGDRRLMQRLELAQRDLGIRHRSLMLVAVRRHRQTLSRNRSVQMRTLHARGGLLAPPTRYPLPTVSEAGESHVNSAAELAAGR